MRKTGINYWPLISSCSIIIFTNVTIFTIVNTKLNFPLYATVIFIPMIFWSAVKFLLDNIGYTRKIKEKWYKFPDLVHEGISLFCFFWSGYFIIKIIMPILKKEYVEDKR